MFFANCKSNRTCAGKAEWKISNNQKYLDINADDYYSLGYLEGKYLKSQIKKMKNFIFFTTPPLVKVTYKKVKNDAKVFLPFISKNYIEEMKGIADGCCLGFDDILAQNVYWDLIFGKYFPEKYSYKNDVMGCTALGAINYDDSTIVGQTYDFPKVMNSNGFFQGGFFPTLAYVSHQVSDKPKIFGLRMGAGLNLPTAKNENGLTVVFNIIISNVHAKPTIPFSIGARLGLEKTQTAINYKNLLYSNSIHPVGHNVIISDKKEMIGIQSIPFENRSRVEQILVNTNRYIYDDWNNKYFAKGDYSLTRQENAEKLMTDKYKNKKLTDDELLSILGREYIKGEPQDSEICRDCGLFSAATLAFFTTHSFGLGIVRDGIGKIPF